MPYTDLTVFLVGVQKATVLMGMHSEARACQVSGRPKGCKGNWSVVTVTF